MKRIWGFTMLAGVWLILWLALIAIASMWAHIAHHLGSTKDFWDIATAVGTCGAAIAAVWIASTDKRQKRRESLALARVVAAGIELRLSRMRTAVKEAFETVEAGLVMDIPQGGFKVVMEQLDGTTRFSHEELRALIPLPNFCADSVAAASDRMHIALSQLSRELDNGHSTFESRRKCLKAVRASLLEAQLMLQRAETTVEEASKDFWRAIGDMVAH
ncbi:hypothetical protein [Burkholderia gladioli]|uniref:hypothetical protein n=1 Tax=Burkholderia gladioli TaxID=28095 RepID=UPI001C270E7C|nr:hypothetical protein [Burkholderia gladioli]MBU9382082.1 hypothetical protein [Burkholderia gladioli]